MPLSDTADLVLFFAPQSRAFMSLWLLEELDRPYRIERLNLNRGDQKTLRLMQYNPMGKVPTLLEGQTAISETGAIITYLVDKYAPGRLGPEPQDACRAEYLKWLFFAPGVIEPAFGEKFFKWELPSRAVGWGSFADMHRTMTDALSQRDWLVGEGFTGADLYVSSILRFGMMFGALGKEGAIAEYVERCEDRPAYHSARRIEERCLAEQQSEGED